MPFPVALFTTTLLIVTLLLQFAMEIPPPALRVEGAAGLMVLPTPVQPPLRVSVKFNKLQIGSGSDVPFKLAWLPELSAPPRIQMVEFVTVGIHRPNITAWVSV